jgi:hypothetical protein
LRHRPVSDVEAQALPIARLARVVVDDYGFIADPESAPVTSEHAVGAVPWLKRAFAALVLGKDAVPVGGVQACLPEVRGATLFDGVPPPALELGAGADP